MATPDAPLRGVEDNIARTMTFIPNPSYTIGEHEFSLDEGSTFSDCTSSTISIPEGFYEPYAVQVRVKEINPDTASAVLMSRLAYFAPSTNDLIPIDAVAVQGQSNAQVFNNRTNPLVPTISLAWRDDTEEIDAWGDADSTATLSFGAGFAYRSEEITGRPCFVIPAARGGTRLQYNASIPDDTWAEESLVRYDSSKIIARAINAIRTNSNYYFVSFVSLWNQGESDTDNAGPTYAQELESLAEYNNVCNGIEKMYVSTLGYELNGRPNLNFDVIRDKQYEAIANNDLIELGYDDAKMFIEWGWMYDDTHWEIQGKMEAGYISAEVANNVEPVPYYSTTTEIAPTDHLTSHLQFNVDGENPFDTYVLNTGATVIPSTLFSYGSILDVDGLGGYVEIPNKAQKTDSLTVSAWVKVDTKQGNADWMMWGDYGGGGSGHAFSANTKLRLIINGKEAYSTTPCANYLFGFGWVHLAYTIDYTLLIPKVEFFVNGVSDGIVFADAGNGFTDWTKNLSNSFYIGAAIESSTGAYAIPQVKFQTDEFKLYDRVLTPQEIALQANDTLYESLNTPVTPDAPVITEENNDTNTFAWTATGDVEMQLKGAGWNDATSPYDVGYNDYAIGEIEIRVKAEGVNPVSAIASNTIAFTEAEVIDKTTVELNVPDTSLVRVYLFKPTARYKTNSWVSREIKTEVPDENNDVSFTLADTDSMAGNHFYIIDMDGARWKFKVPKQTTIRFSDCPKVRI